MAFFFLFSLKGKKGDNKNITDLYKIWVSEVQGRLFCFYLSYKEGECGGKRLRNLRRH